METGAVCQRCTIMASVARIRRDEADGAVQGLAVIPSGEGFHPGLRICFGGKSLARPVWAILAGAEQGFGERVSLLTRGRLQEAMMPSFFSVTFIVAPFIGLPLSACRTTGREMQASAQTAFWISAAAKSALSHS